MPFYESYFLVHKKATNQALRSLLSDGTASISKGGGSVFKFRDFGWRHTGYMLRKSGVGQFHYGRWFQLLWGGHPSAVEALNDLFRHNTSIGRFITFKIDRPSELYSERSTFFKAPEAYKRESSETRHPKKDLSI